jgi:hypothetical protein
MSELFAPARDPLESLNLQMPAEIRRVIIAMFAECDQHDTGALSAEELERLMLLSQETYNLVNPQSVGTVGGLLTFATWMREFDRGIPRLHKKSWDKFTKHDLRVLRGGYVAVTRALKRKTIYDLRNKLCEIFDRLDCKEPYGSLGVAEFKIGRKYFPVHAAQAIRFPTNGDFAVYFDEHPWDGRITKDEWLNGWRKQGKWDELSTEHMGIDTLYCKLKVTFDMLDHNMPKRPEPESTGFMALFSSSSDVNSAYARDEVGSCVMGCGEGDDGTACALS